MLDKKNLKIGSRIENHAVQYLEKCAWNTAFLRVTYGETYFSLIFKKNFHLERLFVHEKEYIEKA